MYDSGIFYNAQSLHKNAHLTLGNVDLVDNIISINIRPSQIRQTLTVQ